MRKIGVPSAPQVHRQRLRERCNDLAFFLMAGLVVAGMFWLLERVHDGRRERNFCVAAVGLVLGDRYADYRIIGIRLEDHRLTRAA